MLIDSHAHLFREYFGGDLHDVIQRARDAGVDRIVVPGTDKETSEEALNLAEKYEFIYPCVGFHPHDAHKVTDKLLGEIELLASNRKVVAIGEIGLDYHYDFSPWERQEAVFKDQIMLAARRDLPIIVHTRDSLERTVGIIEQCLENQAEWKGGGDAVRGVFHCFTGSAREAANLFAKRFFVSYPGIITFKNSPFPATLKEIGCERILLETDSPYLAPTPLRGRRNEPANVIHINRRIAEILGFSESDVADATSRNAQRLFAFDKRHVN